MEPLKCTKIVARELGRNPKGKMEYKHEPCGEPAAEYEIGGLLTTAKAVLCERHKKLADRQNFVSKGGYKYGQVKHKEGRPVFLQERLPGTGVR